LRKQRSGLFTYQQESNKGHHQEPDKGSAAPRPSAAQSHLGHKTHICLPSQTAASLRLGLTPQRNSSSPHKPIFHEHKKALPSLLSSLPKNTEVQRSLSSLQKSSESQTCPRPATVFFQGPWSAQTPLLHRNRTHGGSGETKRHKEAPAVKFLNCRGEQRGTREQQRVISGQFSMQGPRAAGAMLRNAE